MRPIDADALSQHFKHMWWPTGESYKGVLIDDIYNAPTIDAAPVVRGKWEDTNDRTAPPYRCSACKKRSIWKDDYCPNCGACMKEV